MSRLVLIATPLGNLGDLAPRALEELRSVGLVCCEDTRRTGLLLNNLGIAATLMRLDEHTEVASIQRVIDALDEGRDVALVSDAGTPAISDPGERLVAAVAETGHVITSVPGPSAVVMAVTLSGLPTSRFVFEGFLPRSGRERDARLAEIARETRTSVLYEAPHRIERTLADLAGACGDDRRGAICRELTKVHEEVRRGSLGELIGTLGEPRGEYVIVVAGTSPSAAASEADVDDALRNELEAGSSVRDAADAVSSRLGVSRKIAYDRALVLRNSPRNSLPNSPGT
ncbi:MAG: 16S rRNA (cytidine(1402)-2'-O)-methyltransferase [Actinobacteria bacterium]|nr:16S rRNA (cytidine(1402)-2'-O)-methyltransferase [Actinomycetota bacterium]